MSDETGPAGGLREWKKRETRIALSPDCYVAWASAAPRTGPPELTELDDAVGRWFGALTPVGA